MLYATVNEQSQDELHQMMKSTPNSKWYRRLKVIDLSARGYSVPELTELFELSAGTIRTYIHKYNQGGLAGLLPAYGRGRPRSLDWDKSQWLDLLHQPPSRLSKLGSGAQNWTQELLQKYFACYQQQELSQGAISKAIKRAGLRWRRAKLTVKSPDPMYVVKRQRVRELSAKALQGTLTSQAAEHPPPAGTTSRTHLVFFDSTDLHWCPDIGATYTAQGQQVKVGSPGYDNPWYGLLGSLYYPSGEGLYTVHTNKRHQEVQAHLQLLIDQDPDAFWFVVLDNASAHTTPKLDSFYQSNAHRLELVFLPTYSPHLNLIERLWRFMRSQVTRNHFADSLTTLAEAVVRWLENLPFARFCSLMGLDESQLQFV